MKNSGEIQDDILFFGGGEGRIGKETCRNLLRRRLLVVGADQMAVAFQPGQVLQ